MNRPGKNTLLMVALLLAAAVAYFDDPVLSDPQRGSETTPVPTASPTPTSTPPEISATSTPPTATSTAGINSPPTVQVMTFGGIGQARPFPDDKVYKVNISGSRVSIKLRGQDEDGNLDYLAIVDEDDEILGQADCDAAMGSECTLEVTIPSPAEYDRAFTYHGIAVDSEGAVSEKSTKIEVTSVWDKGSYVSSPSPSPRPPGPVTPPRPPTPSPSPVPPVDDLDPVLTIGPPAEFDPIIANLPAVIRPQVTYDGEYHRLSFSLVDEPGDMAIDSDNGTITWTPQESDEGETVDVEVHVTDGARNAQTTFQVTVVEPEEIETEITESATDGNKLTVTATSTTLEGLLITSPPDEDPISTSTLRELQQTLGKAPAGSVPDIPSGITPISDVFVVSSTFDNPVELSFPLSALPDGVSLDDVDLYAYVETSIHGAKGKLWSPVFVDFSFEGTEEEPVYVVELPRLEGMAFFGYRNTTSTQVTGSMQLIDSREKATYKPESLITDPGDFSVRGSSISVTPPMESEITCVRETGLYGIVFDRHVCTASSTDLAIKIIIRDFPVGTGWAGGVSITTLASWVITAQRGLDALALGYDKEITVDIEDMSAIHRDSDLDGYVSPIEARKTLHITNSASTTAKEIKNTVFHEYFHHAQGHDDTKIAFMEEGNSGETLLFIGLSYLEGTDWLIEGTAAWFPDEVDDSLDEDLNNAYWPIMEVGLNSQPADPLADPRRFPYGRFAFFKLLTENCQEFQTHIRNLLNDRGESILGVAVSDRTGIRNLVRILEEAECDIGKHFGNDRSGSIEAAIAYYNYSTLLKQSMSLLDDNEIDPIEDLKFFRASTARFVPELPATLTRDFEGELWYDRPHRTLQQQLLKEIFQYRDTKVTNIPAAGAFSVDIPAVNLSSGDLADDSSPLVSTAPSPQHNPTPLPDDMTASVPSPL